MSGFTVLPPLFDAYLPVDACTSFYKELYKNGEGLLAQDCDLYSCSHRILTSKNLGVAQICSSSLIREYSDFLEPIGVPIYTAPGCDSCTSKCAIVCHGSYPFRTLQDYLLLKQTSLTVAVNSFCSCSGWLVLLNELGKFPVSSPIRNVVQSGSHAASMRAINDFKADIASVDAVAYELLRLNYPSLLQNIKVLAWSDPILNPPFVTSKEHSQRTKATLKQALLNSCSQESDCIKLSKDKMCLHSIDATCTVEMYAEEVEKLLANAQRAFPVLMSSLKPGRSIRNKMGLEDGTVVDSLARIEDENYLANETKFLGYLAHGLTIMLIDSIVQYHNLHDISVLGMTKNSILEALESMAKKEMWKELPLSQCKVVICSTTGVMQLLQNTVSSNFVLNYDQDSEYIGRLEELLKITSSAKEMYAAGFMGGASEALTDYFDYTDENNLLATLWSVDLGLSQRLIEEGEKLGLIAYVTAPRLNDRGDWGNLVLSYDEKGLIGWRDNISHSSARRYIAPHCYDFIRLHRGLLSYGEERCEWYSTFPVQMKQTVFLRSIDIKSMTEVDGRNQMSVPFYVNRNSSLEEELSTLVAGQQKKFSQPLSTTKLTSTLANEKTFLREIISYSK